MLKKVNRLKKVKDINLVHQKGKAFFTKFLVAKTTKNGLEISRFAILISKKVHKSAVKRNRIRRIINGELKNLIKDITSGYDVILIISKNVINDDKKTVKKEDLIKTVKFVLNKTNLLNEK